MHPTGPFQNFGRVTPLRPRLSSATNVCQAHRRVKSKSLAPYGINNWDEIISGIYFFYFYSIMFILFQTRKCNDNWPFQCQRRIIRLRELGQIFVVGLAMRLQYKNGPKSHYASRRTILRSASFKTN